MVSVCGVVVATIALVCALSVYNGFNDLVSSLFSNFDPELKIMPRKGKVFDPTSEEIRKVRELPGIVCFSEVLQDNALVRYRDRQGVATLKGVDEQYEKLAQIDSILIDGKFLLNDEVANYANMGIGLDFSLGINAGFVSPLEIYAPKREEKVNMANPASSFNLEYVILVGPDEAAYEQVDENLKDRVIFLSREKLQVMNDEERNWFLRETVSEVCNWRKSEGLQEDAEKFLPLYISVDKDVLCTEDAQTTWSQGDMRLTTLVSGVQTVLECADRRTGEEGCARN